MTATTTDERGTDGNPEDRGICSHKGCEWRPSQPPGNPERNEEILQHKLDEHDGELVPGGGRR